jgi:hypothetical protein
LRARGRRQRWGGAGGRLDLLECEWWADTTEEGGGRWDQAAAGEEGGVGFGPVAGEEGGAGFGPAAGKKAGGIWGRAARFAGRFGKCTLA